MDKKKKIIVNIFGNADNGKYKMLNRHVDKLLQKPEYVGIEKQFNDMETEPAVVKFCKVSCMNPSNLPALLMSVVDETGNEFFMPNPEPDKKDDVCKTQKLYQYLGLQTDYTGETKGVISGAMIESIFKIALSL